MNNHKIYVLTTSTVAGPEDRSRNVCLPDPKFPLPFFPLDFSTNAMKYQRKKSEVYHRVRTHGNHSYRFIQ